MSRMGVGMLPNEEYRGIFSACKRIWAEEGPLAFYRGYWAYILAVKPHFKDIDYVLDEHIAIGYRIYDDEHATVGRGGRLAIRWEIGGKV